MVPSATQFSLSETCDRYLHTNTLEEYQKVLSTISLGFKPRHHASEVPIFLTSCPLGTLPGQAASINRHILRATSDHFRGPPFLEQNKAWDLFKFLDRFRYSLSELTGHNGWVIPSGFKAGKLMFGGALSILWFLYRNLGLTGTHTRVTLCSPVARVTRNSVLCNKKSSDSSVEEVIYSNTLSRFQRGKTCLLGGLSMKKDRIKRPNSESDVSIWKATLRGTDSAPLYTCMVFADKFSDLKV